MFKKTVPISKQRHAKKKIRTIDRFSFAEGNYIVSLLTTEFMKAATVYPIVFVNDGLEIRPFALLGLKQGENLFVDKEGRWKSHYVPAIIRRYPFLLGKSEDSSDLMLCIDEESEFISETEGEPLFDEKGKPGPIIESVKNYLTELQKFNELTALFSKALSELDLLMPLKMQVKNTGGDTFNIEGAYAVNEAKLNSLPDEDFMELRKRGALSLIYAHIVSLSQIERLVQMQTERT